MKQVSKDDNNDDSTMATNDKEIETPTAETTSTEKPTVDDEEARLRERLKSKKAAKERDQSNGSDRSRSKSLEREGSLSGEKRRRSHSPSDHRGGRKDRRRSSDSHGSGHRRHRRSSPPRDIRHRSGGGGDYPPYSRPRGGPPPPHRRGPYGGPPGYPPHRPPPHWRGPPPPGRGRSYEREEDDFGRIRRPAPSRSRSRSKGDTVRSRSRGSESSRSSQSRGRHHRRSRSRSRSRSSSSDSRSSYSSSGSSASSSSASSADSKDGKLQARESTFTKDQRTVFVNQLVQRASEKDIRKYFTKQGFKVNEVSLLRDRRTGRHKGCAYVELRNIADVSGAVSLSGQKPDFQGFPILVKQSEAEKNYVASKSQAVVTAADMGAKVPVPPLLDEEGNPIEAQKVYVGSLSPTVTQEQLFALFSPFGQLEKVLLQMDTATGLSKGFAFLTFRDPKEANLAIQSMAAKVLAGRPIKTGWAKQGATVPGVKVVTSNEFPLDATVRIQNAYLVLAQLTVGGAVPPASTVAPTMAVTPSSMGSAVGGAPASALSRIPTVAEARASLVSGNAAGVGAASPMVPMVASTVATTPMAATTDKQIGNADNPTKTILVHNMFDKDEETEEGWEKDIKEEFEEECAKYGIANVVVMSKEPGGKIYAAFDTMEGAKSCALVLQGRWFDKRQLQVEYVADDAIPNQDAQK